MRIQLQISKSKNSYLDDKLICLSEFGINIISSKSDKSTLKVRETQARFQDCIEWSILGNSGQRFKKRAKNNSN